jgi:hypothetical protein
MHSQDFALAFSAKREKVAACARQVPQTLERKDCQMRGAQIDHHARASNEGRRS